MVGIAKSVYFKGKHYKKMYKYICDKKNYHLTVTVIKSEKFI